MEDPTTVSITVAAVRYSSLGVDRKGVCSTFLADRLQIEEKAPIFVHPNPDFRLPQLLSTPVVMIGPGTGLAPFRSFIAHRQSLAQPLEKQHVGQAVLFFGCRNEKDFLYGRQLEQWHADGAIVLHVAFSRNAGAPKTYVQSLIRDQAHALLALFEQGAHCYVCGDARNMAPDVDRALRAMLGDQKVDQMSAGGRYQRDVWFG